MLDLLAVENNNTKQIIEVEDYEESLFRSARSFYDLSAVMGKCFKQFVTYNY